MTGRFALGEDRIVCESNAIRVEFDADSGSLVGIENVVTGQQMISSSDPAGKGPTDETIKGQAVPWRLTAQGVTTSVLRPLFAMPGLTREELTPVNFGVDLGEDDLMMRWSTSDDGVHVEVRVRIASDGSIELWPAVLVAAESRPPAHFDYPVIAPGRLSEERDLLLFPAHSGWVIDDPLEHRLEAPYPDGYLGCSIQMLAYYTADVGGFLVATHDTQVTHKVFRFSESEMSISHDSWDLRRGVDIDLGYPVVITGLIRGDWYEAAERYRTWALTAPWASKGPNADRVDQDRPRWLFEEIGLSVWGAPSSLDWSDRYRFYAETAGTPLHVTSGWDWPASRPHYVGKEGWFPARFHPANLEAWEGHYVTPYMNDLFISPRAQNFFEQWEPNLVFPYQTFPFTIFSEPSPDWIEGKDTGPDPAVVTDIDFFVCPVAEVQRDLHAWRDAQLVGEADLDGVCYDISSGNPFAARCLRADHGHSPGWSREVLQAYADNNAASRRAMKQRIGRTPAQGVETIVEHVIADVDFYVSRAVAGPLGALESMTLGPERQPGQGWELVPLFQGVYHDVGPVHEDGWLTFDRELGDLYYWAAARLVLQWGGVLSLHYANNPPERIPGHETAEVISWDGALHRFEDLPELDEGKAAFAGELARLRTGIGNGYLGYGRMLRPLDLDVPTIELAYKRRFAVLTGLTREGRWTVPQVVHGAWREPGGWIGLFFVNIHPTDDLSLTAAATPDRWGVESFGTEVSIDGQPSTTPITNGRLDLEVVLPPRRPVVIELYPGDLSAG